MSIDEFKQLISGSRLRFNQVNPFFATLAYFARFEPSREVSSVATDGRVIFVNPEFIRSLPPAQRLGLLLHVLLHLALLHPVRRGNRDPNLWNISADIVVNAIILETSSFELPPGACYDPSLAHLRVEEIYELLLKDCRDLTCPNLDLLKMTPGDCPKPTEDEFVRSSELHKDLESYWRDALEKALVVSQTKNYNHLPQGLKREIDVVTVPQLDWRSHLWRYLVKTPTDYGDWDRRFIYQRLYLEGLSSESVQVFIAVDTSGSVNAEGLRLFIEEVKGILSAYPHIQCVFYYADADLHGPYELHADSPIPPAQGGGGTSFVPFFEAVRDLDCHFGQALCVYLTDGYGEFPNSPPAMPVLWVVPPGGLEPDAFPFGEVSQLLLHT